MAFDAEELARVTRPGGRACHVIDASDHRRYVIEGLSPLAFLDIESTEPLVHGSNRLRPQQLADEFVEAGFVVDELRPIQLVDVDERARAGFVEPHRSMPLEELAVSQAVLRAHLPEAPDGADAPLEG